LSNNDNNDNKWEYICLIVMNVAIWTYLSIDAVWGK
jgi:hypothetical protein